MTVAKILLWRKNVFINACPPARADGRRFKKLLEQSGLQKELRKHKYYEKPCEARWPAELRKQSAIRKAKTQS